MRLHVEKLPERSFSTVAPDLCLKWVLRSRLEAISGGSALIVSRGLIEVESRDGRSGGVIEVVELGMRT